MLSLYTQIGPWNIPTFRLTVSIAIVLSLFIALYRQPSRGRIVDAYIGALILGLIGARIAHVALNWDYFADNTSEIWIISAGGLDWHGALWGGLLGLALVRWTQTLLSRWLNRPLPDHPTFHPLLDSLTPALPLIGLGGWIGCLAAGCGYGKEVDTLANYPSWMTSLLVDVFGIVAPRYNTPYFGMLLCGIGFMLVLISVVWRRRSPQSARNPRRFWLLVVILSMGMLLIGFYRADHTIVVYGLRADQLLDVIMLLWGLVLLFRSRDYIRKESA